MAFVIIDDDTRLHGQRIDSWTIAPWSTLDKWKPDALIISSDSKEDTLYANAMTRLKGRTDISVCRLYGNPSISGECEDDIHCNMQERGTAP